MPDIKDFVYYDENDTTQTTKTTVENTPQTSEYWTSKDSNDVKDKLNEIIGEINQFTAGKDGTDGQDGKDGADADNDAIATALSSDTDFITAVAESVEPETIQKIDITNDPWYEREWSTDDILKKVEVQLSNGDVFEGVVEYFNGFYQISFTGDFERDIVFNQFSKLPFAVVVANDINKTTVADAIKATDEWSQLDGIAITQLTYILLGEFEYNPDTKTATYTAGTNQIKVVVSDEPLAIEKVYLWEPTSEVVSAEVDLSNYYNKQEVDSLVADASVDLSNYFDKSEINTLLAAYETQDQLDQRLANYYNKNNTYSKTEVDALIAGLGSTDLSGYYTKDESDDKYAAKTFDVDTSVSTLSDNVGETTNLDVVRAIQMLINDDAKRYDDIQTLSEELKSAYTTTTTITKGQDTKTIDQWIDEVVGTLDLLTSSYYNKTEVDALISGLDSTDIPYLTSFSFSGDNWNIISEKYSVSGSDETTKLLWSVDDIEKITKGIGTALNDLEDKNKFIGFKQIPKDEWSKKNDLFTIEKHKGLRIMVKVDDFYFTSFLGFDKVVSWGAIFEGNVVGEKWWLDGDQLAKTNEEILFYDNAIETINGTQYRLTEETYDKFVLQELWIENKEFKEVS